MVRRLGTCRMTTGTPPDDRGNWRLSCATWAGCWARLETRRQRTVACQGGSAVSVLSRFAGEQYCYLTTRGRVTGRPHRIEIWFAIDADTLYMLSGGGERSDWVKNLRHTPAVTVDASTGRFEGRARIVTDRAEDEHARALVHDKYAPGYRGDLTAWRRSALPIAVDIDWQRSDR
jgi:deazaflavin-dependent oxidoreductase (nitroreductase family)